MAGTTGDRVWVDVLPSLDKFVPLMRVGLASAAGVAGQSGVAAGAAFGKGFGDTAATALDAAATKVGAAQKRMADATGQLNVALARLSDLMDADSVSAGRLAAANEAVAKAQRNVQLQTEALSTAQKQQTVVTKAVSDAGVVAAEKQAAMTTTMSETNIVAKTLTGTMGLATKALTVGFTAALIGLPFVAAIRDAQSFDRQMLLVQTQAGASAAEVRNLTPAILGLAGKTAQAPEELALSLYHVESTGIRSAQALDVVAASARFATVAHANLEETTNALTSTVASGIGGFKNMNEAVGILNATVGAGDMKLSDLNEALGSGVLTVVKTIGLNIRDVAAALAVFGDNNIRGASAATDLRLAVQALAVPSKAGRGELEKLGLTTDQLAKDMQTGGLNKAITDLRQHLIDSGVSTEQTGQILTEVFGKKAGVGLAVLVSQFDRLQTKYDEVNKQANDFASAWDATTKSAAFAFQSLLDSLKAFAVEVGNAILPVLTKIALAVSSFFSGIVGGTGAGGQLDKFFSNLADGVKQLWDALQPLISVALVGLKLAFSALLPVLDAVSGFYKDHKTLINSLVIVIGTFLGILKAQELAMVAYALVTGGVSTALGVLRGIWIGLNVIFAASPIGAIITLIAALAAGLVFAWQNSQTFRDIVIGVWNAVKTAFEVAINWIIDHWKILLLALPGIGPVILAIVEIVTHFGTIWQAVTGGLKTAWDAVSGALVGSWNAVWGAMSTAYHAVVDALSGAWKSTVDGLKTAWDAVGSALQTAWGAVWGAISTAYHTVVDPLLTAWNATIGGLKTAWDAVGGALQAAWNAIWTAVKAAWDAVGAAISTVWNTVIQPVWNVMMDIAKVLAIAVGVLVLGPIALAWKGIQDAISAAWVAIQAVWNALQAAAQFMLNNVLIPTWNAIQVAWNAVWTAMQAVYNSVVVPVWNALQAAAQFMLNNVLQPTWNAIQAAWAALWAAMQAVYNSVILPVWNALQAAAQAMWNFLVNLWNTLRDTTVAVWTALTTALSLLWTNFQNALQSAAQNLWNFLVNIWNTLRDTTLAVWNALIGALTTIWTNFQNNLQSAAQNLWNFLVNLWNTLRDTTVSIWNTLSSVVIGIWNGFYNTVTSVAQNVWNTVAGIFHAMSADIGNIWQVMVNAVQTVWHAIQRAVAVPVNFVIQYVFNDGLFKAWNWVVDTLGLPGNWHANPFPLVTGFAEGGYTGPGMFGTGGRMDPAGVVHAGEFVHTQEKTRKFRPLFEAIHSGAVEPGDLGMPGYAWGGRVVGDGVTPLRHGAYVIDPKIADRTTNFLNAFNAGQAEAVQAAGGWNAHPYYWGGLVDALPAGQLFANQQAGKPYVWGGVGPAGYDCSGFQSAITNVLRGSLSPYSRVGTTATFPWPGFTAGLTSGYGIGATKDAGGGVGHMAGTIAGLNAEAGGAHNNVATGSGAAGALASLFNIHASLPQSGGVFTGGTGNGTAAGGSASPTATALPGFFGTLWHVVTDVLGDLKKAVGDPLGKMVGTVGNSKIVGLLEQMPVKLVDQLWNAVVGKITSAFNSLVSAVLDPGGPAVGTPVTGAFGSVAAEAKAIAGQFGWSSAADWNDLSFIAQNESGFNPKAQNPTSTASGIWQQIDATWRAYRLSKDAGFAHMKDAPSGDQDWAGYSYIKAVYKTPAAARAHWEANHSYDSGGLWPSGSPGWNNTGHDERVLTPKQDNYFRDFVDATKAGGGHHMPAPIWHFRIGETELTDLVDARVQYQVNQDARNIRSAR